MAVIFYNVVRCHLFCIVIEKLFKSKIAVKAVPACTSDRLQPLDISVSAAFKNSTKEALDKTVARMMRQMPGEYTFSGQDLWNGILGGHNQSMSTRKCTSAFRKAGLWPLDSHFFCESELWKTIKEPRLQTISEYQRMLRTLAVD